MAAKRKTEDDILKAAMARVAAAQGGEAPTLTTPPKIKAKEKAETAAPKSTKSAEVAYTPLDEGDPVFTIFFGKKFKANLPVTVTDQECIDKAKSNPWFSVDGKPGPKRVKPQPREFDPDAAMSGLPAGFDPAKHEVELEEGL